MFTGIIEKKGEILSAKKKGMSRVICVGKPAGWILKEGQSIAVDGICSTVRAFGTLHMEVEYMPETLKRTTARAFAKGRIVNLERSLRYGAPMDGHFVQGHVDSRGKVVRVLELGASRELSIQIPQVAAGYITPKGSIAVNGVSLTIASLKKNVFSVALVSHTLKHTNLARLSKGDEVNIETDMIARYLARLTKK